METHDKFNVNDTVTVYRVKNNFKSRWFDGIVRNVSSRGLWLAPVNEPKDHGFSEDINACSWLSYPEFAGNEHQFRLLKKVR